MIAVDTNILVNTHRAELVFHEQTYDCLRVLAEGAAPWGIPVSCLHGFLAVVWNPQIFNPTRSVKQSIDQIDTWRASPRAHVLHSCLQHGQILSELAVNAKLQGRQFHDARIAAICIENSGSVLWSADRDFGRFKAVKTANPRV